MKYVPFADNEALQGLDRLLAVNTTEKISKHDLRALRLVAGSVISIQCGKVYKRGEEGIDGQVRREIALLMIKFYRLGYLQSTASAVSLTDIGTAALREDNAARSAAKAQRKKEKANIITNQVIQNECQEAG